MLFSVKNWFDTYILACLLHSGYSSQGENDPPPTFIFVAAQRIWRWGGHCIGRCGVNIVKTLTFKNGGGCMHDPPSSCGGAAPDHRSPFSPVTVNTNIFWYQNVAHLKRYSRIWKARIDTLASLIILDGWIQYRYAANTDNFESNQLVSL